MITNANLINSVTSPDIQHIPCVNITFTCIMLTFLLTSISLFFFFFSRRNLIAMHLKNVQMVVAKQLTQQ